LILAEPEQEKILLNSNLSPIDLVYTWVDGSDPDWVARNHEALMRRNLPIPSKSARFANHDELRYSMRSAEKFLPWVRKIFLVTDCQRPKWLDTNHPKIQIVDHREIFRNTADLPTFNSTAIEANLHHISGLSERYIYLNDDMMLGRPFEPSDFFTPDGRPRTFIFKRPDFDTYNFAIRHASGFFRRLQEFDISLWMRFYAKKRTNFSVKLRNTRLTLLRHLKKGILYYKTNHTPIAHTLTQMNAVEAEFAEELRICSSHRFRNRADLYFPDFFAIHGQMTGATEPRYFHRGDLFYFHLGRSDVISLRKLLGGNYSFININDAKGEISGDDIALFRTAMNELFPLPSPFEKPEKASVAS
jgi:hypothetical protein